jgi:hypothetical protein
MTNDRNYPAGTREALFVLSRGQCYEPQCGTPVVRLKGGRWYTTAHIAHISGLNEGSARFDESMRVPERNSFANLLLLCKPHHTEVDAKAFEDKFPKEMLIEWKTAREGDYADDLLDLGPVTESMLKGWMTEAVVDTRAEIADAFDRLQDVSNDFLASLKQAALDFFDLPYLDPDDIKSLEYTASVFQHIPDYADQLSGPAHDLRYLPDTAELLALIRHEFRDLPDSAEILATLRNELSGLPDAAEILFMASRAINEAGLAEFVRCASGIQSSASDLADASRELSQVAESVTPITKATTAIRDASARFERATAARGARSAWSWPAFWWGAAVCAIFVIAVLALWAHVLARK